MKKLSLIALLFVPSVIFSQSKLVVSGKVKDGETNQNLTDSHIYINEHLGTVSDANGDFSLQIPDEFKNETLHVSFMGFETYEIPVKDIKGDLVVKLQPGVMMLNNVVVTADPWVDLRYSSRNLCSV